MSNVSQKRSVLSAVSAVTQGRLLGMAPWIVTVTCGVLAGLLLVAVHPSLRIPGSALLRGVLPIACGFALARGNHTGLAISLFAGGTLAITSLFSLVAKIPPTVALLAFGPLMDLAVRMSIRLPKFAIAFFALAGAVANSIAFMLRANLAGSLLEEGHSLQSFGSSVFVSFALCGILGGLVIGLAVEINQSKKS